MKTRELTYTALGVALIAVCAWITVPTTVPFTMQTFAVFLVCALLGGKLGSLAVGLYLLLGSFGLPVFSGFRGGLGVLLGATGGYLIGFLVAALAMWGAEMLPGRRIPVLAAGMVLGLLLCYAFGTAWFYFVYTATSGAVGLSTILGWCVFPFLLPDAAKIALALLLYGRLWKFVGLREKKRND